ncbi:hypothetical protein N7519_009607 [Penicillium mononematosum]|uniref:uncharacterized protein n=1 Tax=Penicillium mononematosum TaxID=268346 RepID=UPI002549871F|nr:uncharacterized protein N7519_009607 [Penicillium mononematosum]KAJ6179146.1 hypothetical protein N7519_009607 [Penicillium mononematosum]
MSLTASQKKNRKERKRRARRAAEAAAKAPPPSPEEVKKLWENAHKAYEKASQRQCADPGSGEATAPAGGDLGGPDRGGGQGAVQGATEQAVAEPLPGSPVAPEAPSHGSSDTGP